MKTMNMLKKICLVALVTSVMSVAVAQQSHASVANGSAMSSVSTDVQFGGGGKDGQETHGKG